MFDVLWVSNWEDCAMGYPEKLHRRGIYYGEVAWCRSEGVWGPPLRALLYMEAVGPLPPEATAKQAAGSMEGWARAKKSKERYKHPREPGAGNDQYVHNNFRTVGFKLYVAEREITTGKLGIEQNKEALLSHFAESYPDREGLGRRL